MKEIRALNVGTECFDKATGLKGTITHLLINMGGRVDYLFQPLGLNEQGQPLKKLYLSEERLSVAAHDFGVIIKVPFEVLGTEVTDKASGFTGMAVQFVQHINGCFHVEIQPKGKLPNGTPISVNEFDLRGCVGEAIKVMTREEQKESEVQFPSPSERPPRRLPS